jgi:hypothetical protein
LKLFLFSLVACSTLLASCKKNPVIAIEVIKIEGFKLTDNLGNQFGTNGNAGDDWQIRNWSELSAKEQSFLNFPDTINLANTVVTTLNNPAGYPNPSSYGCYLAFNAADSVKLKIAIVDALGTIYRTFAIKMKSWQFIQFDLSNRTEFPSGKSLRVYYSFSAAAQQNFKAGYGDIKVCDAGPPFTSCF